MELTLEQKRALAMAAARKRMADQGKTERRVISRLPEGYSPDWKKGAQAVDDAVRATANGMTFGVADRLAGALSGEGTEAERARTQAGRERHPVATAIGEIGGSVASVGGLAKSGITASRFAGQKLLPRMLAGSADSLAINEAFNAGEGRDFGENAGLAAAIGAGSPAVGDLLAKGVSKVAGAMAKRPPVMTGDQLKQAGTDALEQANARGVMYTPQAMKRLRDNAVREMADFGYHPSNQPGAAAALSELDRLANQNVTLKGLHSARKLVQGGFNTQNPSNNEALNRIVAQIDDLIANPQTGDVFGNAGAAADDFARFRDLYSRGAKTQRIADLLEKARLQASSTGSGGNVDNATRQKLRTILTDKKAGRGFTADEKAAIEKVVTGTPGQNVLRLAGKLSPSGNGLMAALGVGGAMVNPAVGAVSLGGMGAKALADRQTRNGVEEVVRLIAQGGQKPSKTAVQKAIESKRDLIAKLLMATGVSAVSAN